MILQPQDPLSQCVCTTEPVQNTQLMESRILSAPPCIPLKRLAHCFFCKNNCSFEWKSLENKKKTKATKKEKAKKENRSIGKTKKKVRQLQGVSHFEGSRGATLGWGGCLGGRGGILV